MLLSLSSDIIYDALHTDTDSEVQDLRVMLDHAEKRVVEDKKEQIAKGAQLEKDIAALETKVCT